MRGSDGRRWRTGSFPSSRTTSSRFGHEGQPARSSSGPALGGSGRRARRVEGAVGRRQRGLLDEEPSAWVDVAAAFEPPGVSRMADIEVQPFVGELRETASLSQRALQEGRVLAERAVGVAREVLPDVAAVDEGAAADALGAQARVQVRGARPELPALEIEERDRRERHDVGRPEQKWLHLRSQSRGVVPVVVVPMRDDGSACELAGEVELLAQRCSVRCADVANAGILGQRGGECAVAVLDDHQLAVRVVLAIEVPNGLQREVRPLARRHDAAHEREPAMERPRRGGDRHPAERDTKATGRSGCRLASVCDARRAPDEAPPRPHRGATDSRGPRAVVRAPGAAGPGSVVGAAYGLGDATVDGDAEGRERLHADRRPSPSPEAAGSTGGGRRDLGRVVAAVADDRLRAAAVRRRPREAVTRVLLERSEQALEPARPRSYSRLQVHEDVRVRCGKQRVEGGRRACVRLRVQDETIGERDGGGSQARDRRADERRPSRRPNAEADPSKRGQTARRAHGGVGHTVAARDQISNCGRTAAVNHVPAGLTCRRGRRRIGSPSWRTSSANKGEKHEQSR